MATNGSNFDEDAGLRHGDIQMSTATKIRYVLAGDDDPHAIELGSHPLFTQMDVLVHFEDNTVGWKEISRWLKYEERVEIGERWSKPHVSTTTLRGLQTFKDALISKECSVGLGQPVPAGQHQVADAVIATLRDAGHHGDVTCSRVRDVLLAPHKHKDRNARKSKQSGEAKTGPFRRRSGDGMDLGISLYSYPAGTHPQTLARYKPNKRLTKKLPKNCEVANILVGQVDFAHRPLMVFCRLSQPAVMADLSEIALPTRFVFLCLSPMDAAPNAIWEISEMGRSLGSMLGDKIFCEVAYKAKTAQDLISGIDEYMDGLTVLPPSVWDPQTRLEPPNKSMTVDKVMLRLEESTRGASGPTAEPQEGGASNDDTLLRTGRFFGGMINDMKNCYNPRMYASMLKDGINMQCLASAVFLFFACISPIVTFGGLMGQKTNGHMGTIEMLLAGAICGFFYAIFSGQPLTIIGATGPLLVFESIVCYLCEEYGMHFLSFRFWIGTWVMVILLIIVAFDLSFLVRYITRFTEESFAVLISVIFIYEAFTKTLEVSTTSPIHTGTVRELEDQPWLYHCHCVPDEFDPFPVQHTTAVPGNTSTAADIDANASSVLLLSALDENCLTYKERIQVSQDCISEKECLAQGWNLTGSACNDPHITHAVADVFLLSIMLFVGTFTLAMTFRTFRTSRFFPAIVRGTVADFAVFLSVTTWTFVDYMIGVDTPKLNVPSDFKPTRNDRGWVIDPMDVTHWWLIPLAAIPAMLGMILIFLDQQITSVIVNRKEHKLKKPHGYHLDIFVLAVLIMVCSILGLPWFVAATVRSVTHVRSLLKESEVKIPGEKTQIVGAREQRVTGICIHTLIGLSTLLTAMLRLIPMPVLYGVFLYMGATSLPGVQLYDRLLITMMPVKYQPDVIYLRHVKLSRVHFFTFIQFVCFAAMWIIKSVKTTSITFPVMLLALMGIRKLMDLVFTQTELYWLDHMLPGEEMIEKEDEQKKQGTAVRAGNNNAQESDTFLAKEKEALGEYRPRH